MRQYRFESVMDERALDPHVKERSDMIREARSVAQDVMNNAAVPKRCRPRTGKSIMERIVSRRTEAEAQEESEALGIAAATAGGVADEGAAEGGSMWQDYLNRGGAMRSDVRGPAAAGPGGSAIKGAETRTVGAGGSGGEHEHVSAPAAGACGGGGVEGGPGIGLHAGVAFSASF